MSNFEDFGDLEGWPNHETKQVFEIMGADWTLHNYTERPTVPTAQLARDLEKRFIAELDHHRPASLAYELLSCALARVQWSDIAQHMNAGRDPITGE